MHSQMFVECQVLRALKRSAPPRRQTHRQDPNSSHHCYSLSSKEANFLSYRQSYNELPPPSTSRVKPPTAKQNLTKIVPTHGSRVNPPLSDRHPSFLLHPGSRPPVDQAIRHPRRK